MNPTVAALLRQPRRPHRREKPIVPGVRRLAPPEGRITLCLMNERGKVIHRTEAINAATNQLREMAVTWLRGADLTGLFGFDAGVLGAHTTNTDTNWAAVGSTYPHIYAQFKQMLGSLYLSESAAAVDDDWWFPLGLKAGADLHANNTAFAGNLTRGARVTANSVRDSDRYLYVVDFAADQANGFSIESVGLAGLRYPGTDAFDGVFGWITANMIVSTSAGIGNARNRSHAKASNYQIWVMGEEGIIKYNFQLSAASWAGNTAIREVGPVTLATAGVTSNGNYGIALIGSDFWIADGTRLRRTNIPTSTSMPTVNNTYSPVTGFTDAAILGMCSDGTDLYLVGSTKVFVVSTATGAVTSSWAHNMTNVTSITYDEMADVVWISGQPSFTDGYLVSTASWSTPYDTADVVHNAGGSHRTHIPFSKTGTSLGYGWQPNYNTGIPAGSDHLLLFDECRYISIQWNHSSVGSSQGMLQSGGVLGTRALVAAPFTKTSANPLRVEYEVEFPT